MLKMLIFKIYLLHLLGSWQGFSVLATLIFGSTRMVHTKKRDRKIQGGIYGERYSLFAYVSGFLPG